MESEGNPVVSVLRHRAWLLRLAQRLCGGRPADADDLVQDVLMKFISTFKEGFPHDDARCMAWLATTLRNAFRSNLRKAVVREGAVADPTLEASVISGDEIEPDSFTTITDEEFDRALGCLSEKQLRVFELSHEGKSHAEIGQELGIKVGAVAKRLFDARKRLRDELQRIIDSRKGGLRS